MFIPATDTCKSKGLSENLLDGCIYDIVITDDMTLANQETLQIGLCLKIR